MRIEIRPTRLPHAAPLGAPTPPSGPGPVALSPLICVLPTYDAGRFFVSGGADKKIKLWHYDEGSQYFEGAGHSGAIIMAKISPDEQRIVTVGGEGGIFIWKVPDAFSGGAAAGA